MTDRKWIVWVSRPTFDEEIARLQPHCEVRAEPTETKFATADVAGKLTECDAAIVGGNVRIGANEIAHANRLRIVANLAAGYDNLDLDALTTAGVAATNAGGVLSESVADYVWGLLLGAARRPATPGIHFHARLPRATSVRLRVSVDALCRSMAASVRQCAMIGRASCRGKTCKT